MRRFAPRLFKTTKKPSTGRAADFVGLVKYTPEDVNALYTPPILEAAQRFLSEAITNAKLVGNSSIGIPFMEHMARELMVMLIWRSLTTKHEAYKHEEEVRLVIFGTPAKLSRCVKTRLRESEIVPYIPQPWAVRRPSRVAKIMIGPAAPLDTVRTLQKFLSTLGMDFRDISRSRIPYRVL